MKILREATIKLRDVRFEDVHYCTNNLGGWGWYSEVVESISLKINLAKHRVVTDSIFCSVVRCLCDCRAAFFRISAVDAG